MLTRTRTIRAVPDPRRIFRPNYIGTGDSHNPPASQSDRPIILLPGRPNDNRTGKLRVYDIPAGRVGSINNGTDINAGPVV